MRRARVVAVAVLAAALTVLAGRWGMGLFTISEFVHFSVNFPTVSGADVIDVADVGGPWSRESASLRSGYPAGGLLAWGLEGRLNVDLGQRSWLKRLVQPGTLLLSTHWLRNVGTRPYRIRLELDPCGMRMEWITFERNWDERTRSSTRAIPPGGTFNMDWVLHFPPERRARRDVCRCDLLVHDASDGALLTRFPIAIVDSSIRPVRAKEGD